jgi:hypothetical protein
VSPAAIACRLSIAAVLIYFLAGCSSGEERPQPVYKPSQVGIPDEVRFDADRDAYIVRMGGEQFELGRDVEGLDGGAPQEKSLLLIGKHDGKTWYATAPETKTGRAKGCYALSTPNAWNSGSDILLGFPSFEGEAKVGLLLAKAPGWAHSGNSNATLGRDGRFPWSHSSWCLDAEGRIASVDILLTG